MPPWLAAAAPGKNMGSTESCAAAPDGGVMGIPAQPDIEVLVRNVAAGGAGGEM